MDATRDGPYAREPQFEDLIRLAQALNAHDVARYSVVRVADEIGVDPGVRSFRAFLDDGECVGAGHRPIGARERV